MRYTCRVLPHRAYCPDETARWLEEQAADGWLLKRAGGYTGVMLFERADTCAVRYFAECANRGQPDAFVNENGEASPWVRVGNVCGMEVYRCNAADAVLPARDTQAELAALRKERVGTVVYAVVWAILAMLWVWQAFDGGFWLNMTDAFSSAKLMLGVSILGLVGYRLCLLADIRKAIRALRDAQPSTPTPTVGVTRVVGVIGLVTGVVLAITSVVMWLASLVSVPIPAAEYGKPLECPTIQDLLGGDATLIPDYKNDEPTVEEMWSIAAPSMVIYQERAVFGTADGETVNGTLTVGRYETWSPRIARSLAEQLLEGYYFFANAEPRVHEDLGVDYACSYGWYAVLQKDNTILVVDFFNHIDGDGDAVFPEEWLPYAAEFL